MRIINTSLLFLFVGVITLSCGTDSSTPKNQFFLDSNNVTIKCPGTSPGDMGIVNATEFESVDNELLRNRVQSGADMTKVCTSLVTDMSELFNGTYVDPINFNQPIGSWDVSSVINMEGMFFDAYEFNQNISTWCVQLIQTEPDQFSTISALTEENKPVWGTCPE